MDEVDWAYRYLGGEVGGKVGKKEKKEVGEMNSINFAEGSRQEQRIGAENQSRESERAMGNGGDTDGTQTSEGYIRFLDFRFSILDNHLVCMV